LADTESIIENKSFLRFLKKDNTFFLACQRGWIKNCRLVMLLVLYGFGRKIQRKIRQELFLKIVDKQQKLLKIKRGINLN